MLVQYGEPTRDCQPGNLRDDGPSGPEDLGKKSEYGSEEGHHVGSGGEKKMLSRVKYRHFRGQMEFAPPWDTCLPCFIANGTLPEKLEGESPV
jgi:hypothetical protein